MVHTTKWDQRNNDGQQVSPGRYIVAIPDYTFEGVTIEQVSGGIKFSETIKKLDKEDKGRNSS